MRRAEVKQEPFDNVLIVRTDRIGDLVLTLPMIPALRSRYPSIRISMLLRSYTRELVDGFAGLDSIIPYDDLRGVRGFFLLAAELRRGHFNMAVISHPTFRIALLLVVAGIPVRVGTGYRWYSFLFNRRVFEHRKTAEKHEAEYNCSLLSAAGCDVRVVPPITLPISSAAMTAALAERRRLDIADTDRVVVLHPGSGGSARDWSPENFGDLAGILADKQCTVVVTGTRQEERLVDRVVLRSGGRAKASTGRFSLKELAAFLGSAQLFIANSTGPLHIAATVGTPVIGFYPPIRECSARRWGPLTEKKILFSADSSVCPRCHGGPCQGNDCMDQITVEQVVQAAMSLLHNGAGSKSQ
jgi:heptosyltransferase-2